MKRITVIMFFLFTVPAKADLFGIDAGILAQILAQAVIQYQKIKEIYDTGKDSLEIVKDLNRGIHEALNLAKTIDQDFDPGVFKDWKQPNSSIIKLEGIYGKVPLSADSKSQQHADQLVAEIITKTNRYFEHSRIHDELSEKIKYASRDRSPGGAQRLTAESQGLLIQGLNENLRAQADGNKISAIQLSQDNKQEKDRVTDRTRLGADVVDAFKKMESQKHFELPRY